MFTMPEPVTPGTREESGPALDSSLAAIRFAQLIGLRRPLSDSVGSGGGGIRTHGRLAPTTVFKTVPPHDANPNPVKNLRRMKDRLSLSLPYGPPDEVRRPSPDHRLLYEALGVPMEIMRPVRTWEQRPTTW